MLENSWFVARFRKFTWDSWSEATGQYPHNIYTPRQHNIATLYCLSWKQWSDTKRPQGGMLSLQIGRVKKISQFPETAALKILHHSTTQENHKVTNSGWKTAHTAVCCSIAIYVASFGSNFFLSWNLNRMEKGKQSSMTHICWSEENPLLFHNPKTDYSNATTLIGRTPYHPPTQPHYLKYTHTHTHHSQCSIAASASPKPNPMLPQLKSSAKGLKSNVPPKGQTSSAWPKLIIALIASLKQQEHNTVDVLTLRR